MELKTKEEVEELFREAIKIKNSPDELSGLLLKIGAYVYYLGEQLADNQAKYAQEIVTLLNKELGEGEKRMSVAEAERTADVKTACEHDRLKYARESLFELINSTKARLKVLGDEKIQMGGAK